MIRLVQADLIDGHVQFRKVTPKQYAQDFIASAIQGQIECMDLANECNDEMTSREMELVEKQIVKLANRVYKMMGYC